MEALSYAFLDCRIQLPSPAEESAGLCVACAAVSVVGCCAQRKEYGFSFCSEASPSLKGKGVGTPAAPRRVTALFFLGSFPGRSPWVLRGLGLVPLGACMPEGDVEKHVVNFSRAERPNIEERGFAGLVVLRCEVLRGGGCEFRDEDFPARDHSRLGAEAADCVASAVV